MCAVARFGGRFTRGVMVHALSTRLRVTPPLADYRGAVAIYCTISSHPPWPRTLRFTGQTNRVLSRMWVEEGCANEQWQLSKVMMTRGQSWARHGHQELHAKWTSAQSRRQRRPVGGGRSRGVGISRSPERETGSKLFHSSNKLKK